MMQHIKCGRFPCWHKGNYIAGIMAFTGARGPAALAHHDFNPSNSAATSTRSPTRKWARPAEATTKGSGVQTLVHLAGTDVSFPSGRGK
jgi:hypothetical protein